MKLDFNLKKRYDIVAKIYILILAIVWENRNIHIYGD